MKVALLRGINVGGHKKIKMAELRDLLSRDEALDHIQTYIQSGNIVFASGLNNKDAEDHIQTLIHKQYGFDVPVLVRSCIEWQGVVDNNFFLKRDPRADISKLYVTFLSTTPEPQLVNKLQSSIAGKDQLHIHDDVIYLQYKTRMSDSKLDNNFIERILKVSCTSRNWKTTLKLSAMCQDK